MKGTSNRQRAQAPSRNSERTPNALRLVALVSAALLALCIGGCDSNPESPTAPTAPTTAEVQTYVATIDAALFADAGADASIWQLGLVGTVETVVRDLCDGNATDETCPYSDRDFQKLEAGNGHFDALPPSVQALVLTSNEYFSGNVAVYNANGEPLGKYLNDLRPALGAHALSMVKRETARLLNEHEPPYGNIFWPADGTLEVFASTFPAGAKSNPDDIAVCQTAADTPCSSIRSSTTVCCAGLTADYEDYYYGATCDACVAVSGYYCNLEDLGETLYGVGDCPADSSN